MNIEKIKKQLAQYSAAKAKLAPLKSAVAEMENLCRDGIRKQWGLCRMTKHGAVFDQVREVLGNIHTPEKIRTELAALQPLLEKAITDFNGANREASNLRRALMDSQTGALSLFQSALTEIQDKIFKNLVAALGPYTNEFNAQELAKSTDAYKELEYRLTNLSVLHLSDPETCISSLQSLVSEVAKYGELVK